KMRGRVIGPDLPATFAVHLHGDGFTDLDGAARHAAHMNKETFALLLRAFDLDRKILALDSAGVANLTTRFRIERRLVRNDSNRLALARALDLRTILDKRCDYAFGFLGFVAEKLGGTSLVLDGKPHSFRGRLARPCPACAGFGLLALHGGI